VRYGALALVLAAVGASCFIDRRSGDFACDTDADCLKLGTDIDRECNSEHVCVQADCPSKCDSCSTGKVCNITCNNPTECSSGVACPDEYNCRITCTRNCTPVDCRDAASCQVTCSGNNTQCGPLTCGSGTTPCTCTASNGTCL
jgi:hypothetical protein